jgi:hypothetical protein
LNGLRAFLDEVWADSLDIARRIVEAERGAGDDQDVAEAS